MNKLKIAYNRIASKENKKGKAPLWCTISLSGEKPLKFSTEISLLEDEWNNTKEKVTLKHNRAFQLNQQLRDLTTKIYLVYDELSKKIGSPSLKMIKDQLENKLETKVTLISLYDDYITYVKQRKGVDDKDDTIKHLNSSRDRLVLYMQQQYKVSDILIERLNYEFIQGFEIFLKAGFGNVPNTIDRATSKLKTVIRYGMRMEKVDKNPFIGHRGKKDPTNRQSLTMEEVRRLENLPLTDSHECLIRDMFLFMTYTGLSYVDALDLSEDDIFISNSGNKIIEKRRGKTGFFSTIVVGTKAETIIQKYKIHLGSLYRGKIFPYKRNQVINKILKVIATKAKISKPLTCHIARHTLATLWIENGSSMETLKPCLGHGSIKTTEIYGKVTTIKIEKDYQLQKDFLG